MATKRERVIGILRPTHGFVTARSDESASNTGVSRLDRIAGINPAIDVRNAVEAHRLEVDSIELR